MIAALSSERKLSLPRMARAVLLGCQSARSADDFAKRLVSCTAATFGAEFCIWADRGVTELALVACTPGAERLIGCTSGLAKRTLDEGPRVFADLGSAGGLQCLAAAPMRFRSAVTGVLVAGNRPGGFTNEHLEALLVVGRSAVVRYEQLRLAEELAMMPAEGGAAGTIARLVHELSQPLSVIGAAAFYLEMALPPQNEALRPHLEELKQQVDLAALALQDAARSVRPSAPDSPPGAEPDSRVLTKAASSAVT